MKAYKFRLTPTEIEEILVKLSNNFSLASICLEYGITRYHLNEYLLSDSLFRDKLKIAKEAAAEADVESIIPRLEQAQDQLDLNKAKEIAYNLRWKASKHHRDVYGEKHQISLDTVLDLGDVLTAAARRVNGPVDEAVKLTNDHSPLITVNSTAGQEPVATPIPKKIETFDDLL